jgi:hypothetical protein
MNIRFNGDTGANYSYGDVRGSNNAATANTADLATALLVDPSGIVGSTAPANHFGALVIDILDYNSATDFKYVIYSGFFRTGAGAASVLNYAGGGMWLSAAAITGITIFPGSGNVYGTVQTYGEGG